VEILAVLFEYFQENRELMRIALATMLPRRANCQHQAALPGPVRAEFRADPFADEARCGRGNWTAGLEAASWHSASTDRPTFHLMAHLVAPTCQLNRRTAERIVRLFLAGAGAKTRRT